MIDAATITLLTTATAVSVGAMVNYFYDAMRHKTETSLEIKMDNLVISIHGDLSKERANTIVKAIAESNALATDDTRPAIGAKA